MKTEEATPDATTEQLPPDTPGPETDLPAEPTPREVAIEEIKSRLYAQYDALRDIEGEWETAHHEASVLKKRLEKQQDLVNRIVGELQQAEHGQFTPSLPFEAVGDEDDGMVGHDGERVTGEAWKAVTLADIPITGKLAETLSEAGLATLGAIADYTASGKLLTDLPGIGPGKAEKIEELTAAYWANQPMGEVTSVTLSSGGRSVTLEAACDKLSVMTTFFCTSIPLSANKE